MFSALQPEFRPHDKISVDANGGWNLDDAKTMAIWLADRKRHLLRTTPPRQCQPPASRA